MGGGPVSAGVVHDGLELAILRGFASLGEHIYVASDRLLYEECFAQIFVAYDQIVVAGVYQPPVVLGQSREHPAAVHAGVLPRRPELVHVETRGFARFAPWHLDLRDVQQRIGFASVTPLDIPEWHHSRHERGGLLWHFVEAEHDEPHRKIVGCSLVQESLDVRQHLPRTRTGTDTVLLFARRRLVHLYGAISVIVAIAIQGALQCTVMPQHVHEKVSVAESSLHEANVDMSAVFLPGVWRACAAQRETRHRQSGSRLGSLRTSMLTHHA